MSARGGKRGSINLVALGSAAVLAVYAAGYVRTRPAAQRFERGDFDRRPVPQAAATTPRPVAPAVTLRADSTSKPVVAAVAVAPGASRKATASVAPPSPAAHDSSPVHDTVPAHEDSVPTPAPSAPAQVAAVTDTAKAAVGTDTVKAMKDGTFTGWGTSRHGDIEAAVEIRGGRIVNAYITQCLTRYSCGRIAAIIPQVVQRQSAEVDFVSGATQSTNAFYYAVLEALSKAK